jgi:hypothetical protein
MRRRPRLASRRRVGRAVEDGADLVEGDCEHVGEDVGEPLRRRQRLGHGEQRLVLGVGAVGAVDDRVRQAGVEGLLAARLAGAEHVERHASDGGDEPGFELVAPAGVRAAEPDPRLLDGVVGLARGAQRPVADGPQPGPVLLESCCQPLALVHRSGDPSRAPNVTSRLRAAGGLPLEIANETEPGGCPAIGRHRDANRR